MKFTKGEVITEEKLWGIQQWLEKKEKEQFRLAEMLEEADRLEETAGSDQKKWKKAQKLREEVKKALGQKAKK